MVAQSDSDANALAQFGQQTASQWMDQATGFVNVLTQLAASEFRPELVDASLPRTFTTREQEMRSAIDRTPIRPQDPNFAPPSDPGGLTVSSIREAVNVAVPTFSTAAPALNLPVRPEFVVPDKPVAPNIRDIAVPTAPNIELPETPVLQAVSFPDAPAIQLPIFSAAPPVEPEFLLQTRSFEWVEEPFEVPNIDAARALMRQDLEQGGYGIHPDDEEALWERARDRELRQGQADEVEATRSFASLGYPMPPGAMAKRMDDARRGAQERLSEASREISVTRADLFRQARRFAVEQSVAIDSVRLTQHGFKMERSLNAARFAAEFAIAVYDAEARVYNTKVQAFSTLVQAYSVQLQAELAKMEIYRTEVQAAAEKSRAQLTQVQLFATIIQAAQTRVSLFESQVRAASLEADMERIKLDQFRSQIEAFVGEVRANALTLDAYQGAIRGELAKVQVFDTQVRAFATQVQAAGIESDVRNRNVTVDIERRRAEIAEFAARIEKYRSDVSAETARVGAQVQLFASDTDLYRASMQAWEGLTRVGIAELNNLSRKFEQEVAFEQANSRLQLEAVVESARRRFDAANAGTDVVKAFSEMAGNSMGYLLARIKSEEVGA